MARRPGDATVQLRMTPAERELVNTALGKGNVNAIAVELLLKHAKAVSATRPTLADHQTEEVSAA
jgi:hypothetical protein